MMSLGHPVACQNVLSQQVLTLDVQRDRIFLGQIHHHVRSRPPDGFVYKITHN